MTDFNAIRMELHEIALQANKLGVALQGVAPPQESLQRVGSMQYLLETAEQIEVVSHEIEKLLLDRK